MNFTSCPIENEVIVPKEMVQIRADETEISRRLNCFIERKRKEIDMNNVQDFIEPQPDADVESSCARVSSTVFRVKGAKAHFPTDRVKNEEGPQTGNYYASTLNKLMSGASPVKAEREMEGVEERLKEAECFLHTATESRKSVFERLKRIEDRIMQLESISPEYNHFWVKPVERNARR